MYDEVKTSTKDFQRARIPSWHPGRKTSLREKKYRKNELPKCMYLLKTYNTPQILRRLCYFRRFEPEKKKRASLLHQREKTPSGYSISRFFFYTNWNAYTGCSRLFFDLIKPPFSRRALLFYRVMKLYKTRCSLARAFQTNTLHRTRVLRASRVKFCLFNVVFIFAEFFGVFVAFSWTLLWNPSLNDVAVLGTSSMYICTYQSELLHVRISKLAEKLI